MAQEKIALLYGNNAMDYKLEAARLMSEALCNPDQADDLVDLAIQLFERHEVSRASL